MKLDRIEIVSFFVFIFFLQTIPSYTQEKFKAEIRPEKFLRPILFEDPVSVDRFENDNGKENRALRVWYVVSDHHGAKTYEAPNETSKVVSELAFNEVYYVIDQKDKWLNIVKAKSYVKNQVIKEGFNKGWVKRSDVLLWNSGGRAPKSNIHSKAMILNKAEDIGEIFKEESKNFAVLYNSSEGNGVIDTIKLYEIYYVYKISKAEPKRYLIGKESTFGRNSVEDVILGWVDRSKLTIWNTRICLEPNFDPIAFEERSKQDNFRIVGLDDPLTAKLYATKLSSDKIVWDNDPVIAKSNYLSKVDPRRYIGQIVRFPLLSSSMNEKYIRTATVGNVRTVTLGSIFTDEELQNSTIPSETMSLFEKQLLEEYSTKKRSYNVFFIVEGIKEYDYLRTGIGSTINNISKVFPSSAKVRYGACIYKDALERKRNKDIRIKELTPSIGEIEAFFQEEDFVKMYDTDKENALFYAIQQSLLRGGFDKDATNIICVLANNPDVTENDLREFTASQNGDEKYFMDMSVVISDLEKYDAHTLVIQKDFLDNSSHRYFQTNMREVVIGQAYKSYFEYKNLQKHLKIDIENPTIGEVESSNRLVLQNSSLYSEILKPIFGKTLSESEINHGLYNGLKNIVKFINATYSKLDKILIHGESINIESGTWGPEIAKILYKSFHETYANSEEVKANLLKLFSEKYKLYYEIFLPTSLDGTKNPLYKYVLFMPHEDLMEYRRMLDQLSVDAEKPVDVQRQSLYGAFEELLRQIAGYSKAEIKRTSIDDFRALIQGISSEGYFIGEKLGINIGDLLNDKKTTDDQIVQLMDRIVRKRKEIKNIENLKNQYEFSYHLSELNTYYWIPESYLF